MPADKMTTSDAIDQLRRQPEARKLIEDAYLDADQDAASERFAGSVEFKESIALLPDLAGRVVLDLGAGTGVASRALAGLGPSLVVALDPATDESVGLGRLTRIHSAAPILRIAGTADALPLASASVDVVYCRQVLHHLPDLPVAMREVSRVLRRGGVFVALREHVVDNEEQLSRFLSEHPVHRLAGGENAWSLADYTDAIGGFGMTIIRVLGPWDSIVNAFPAVHSQEEMSDAPAVLLAHRFGPIGNVLGHLPVVKQIVWRRLRRRKAGRLYSFIATK